MIAGCDGFHGVCRPAIDKVLRTFSREYPFGWLGILAEAPPSSDELVYAHHTNGFALLSLRSPTRSRLYLQCRPDEDLEQWPDDRIWAELATRTAVDGWQLNTGPILEKGVTGMRSFVAEPMQHGRLFSDGRRGAHRAADRGEGPEPRDPRCQRARRGARRSGTRTATRAVCARTPTGACAGSGGPSTSRGG